MATQLSDITLSPAAAARVRWIATRKGDTDAALRHRPRGGSSFKVENPNAASGCGCGSSFSI